MWKVAQSARASTSSGVRYFGDSRCRSIWQWQLILALITVAVASTVAFLLPQLLADWRFSAGLSLIIVITVVTLGIPWHLVGPGGVAVVPVLDTLTIGLLANGMLGSGANPAAAFMWIFPVAWIASYYSVRALIGILTLVGMFVLLALFDTGITPEKTVNAVILLLTISFVGMIMSVGSLRSRSTKRLLQGQSARIGVALRRLTEQKARNRRVIDSLDIGIARVGEDGLVEISNRAFHTLYVLDESATFHPTRAVEYDERRGTPIPQSQTTIARASRGELFADELVWLFGLDGQWRALKTSTRVFEAGRDDDGLLLIVEDVTAAVDPYANKVATRRTISHELRNPLTAVLGHVDLLLENEEFTDSTRRQLEVVERASERMQRLIEDALVEPSQPREDTDEDFDLAEIARASIEGFTPTALMDGVTLNVDLDDELPFCGDEFRFRQVVDNIVGNAIKFAQRGGTVTVRSANDSDATGGGETALVISDTGIGISAEDLPRIFEPDFRTELARERGIPGTGLGLGISRDIVLDQGARLDITSELGQGTEVSIVLPTRRERSIE
ncbi:sensor histidine kinase [Microbacterium sp.]|uniref:sensor histidine kinase n=1 Tax=Microbacterium sp. TaxID=51671 RepID=UPI003F9924C1